jgi:hypothetical protein
MSMDAKDSLLQNGHSTVAVPDILAGSRFLQSLSPSVSQEISAKAAWVSGELRAWAAPYAPIRAIRAYPLALSVTAAAPFASTAELLDTARVSLWVFTLDDLFDEDGLSPAELLRRAASYRAIAHGDSASSPDPLAVALTDVRKSLVDYPLFQELTTTWARALCRTIDGMVREQQWRIAWRRDGIAALPGYNEYVKNGLNSIGGPPHIWSAIITTDDSTVLRQMKLFGEIERTASTCVRLANDLQSEVKEADEAKPNSLTILSQQLVRRGVEPSEARQSARVWVQEAITHELKRLDLLRGQARTETGRPEAVATDIAHFVCEFYRNHDYHTFVAEDSSGGLNGNE